MVNEDSHSGGSWGGFILVTPFDVGLKGVLLQQSDTMKRENQLVAGQLPSLVSTEQYEQKCSNSNSHPYE